MLSTAELNIEHCMLPCNSVLRHLYDQQVLRVPPVLAVMLAFVAAMVHTGHASMNSKSA